MSEESLVFTRSGASLIPMQISSGFIMSLFFTFIPLYVYDLYGFIASSLCRTLVAVTAILLSWVWGWVSDVFSSKKKLLVISIFGQAIFTILFALTQFAGEPGLLNLIFILSMYTLASLFTSIYNPVRNAVITIMTKEEDRATNIGSFFLFSSAGWGIGGLIIGYLWDIWPLHWIFILTGSIHLISLIVFQIAFQDRDVKTEEPERRGIIEGLRNVKPLLLYITLAILLVSVGRGIFLPIFQIKMYIIFGQEGFWIGVISALSGFAGAIGALAYGKLTDRIGDSFALKLGIFGNVALFLLGVFNHPITAALVWIFPVWPLIAVSSVSLAAGHSEETRRGEAQGIVESARSFSGFFSVIGGIVATVVGAADNINNLNPFFLSLIILPLLAFIPVSKSKLSDEERKAKNKS